MKINKLTITVGLFCLLSTVYCSLFTVHCPLAFAANTTSDWEDYQKSGHHNLKWDPYIESGFSAFDGGNFGPAEMFLQRAIARGCDDGLVYAKIGTYYETQKNYKKAVDYYKKAAKKLSKQYPKNQTTRSIDEWTGRVLFTMGSQEESIPYLLKALEYREGFLPLYFLGQIYRDRGELDKTILYYGRALKAEHPEGTPPSVDILIMTELGTIYHNMKSEDMALEWFNRILAIDPANQIANSYKAEYDRKKYKEEERRVLEEIVK
jgi:tetratricopeptide (TPR) repeat protein